MGKIRITTIGAINEKQEEAKKVANLKHKETRSNPIKENSSKIVSQKKAKVKKQKIKFRSKNYKAASLKIDKNKIYPLVEALDILLSLPKTKFDETVEVHFNFNEKINPISLTLPHGVGKKTRVAIIAPSKNDAEANALISEIEAGKINFDVLIAEPGAMPLLAKVAKFLGPRGLMPNPKSGTISANPVEAAAKFANGQINFKSEAKQPVMHTILGKVSFGKIKLKENLEAILELIDKAKIKNIYLSSTMSPSIKVNKSYLA